MNAQSEPKAAAAIRQDNSGPDLFRLAVELAPTPMIVITPDGAIQYANIEAARLFGYQIDELVGQSVDILVPMQFRRTHGSLRKEFFKNPSIRSMGVGRNLKATRRDGSEFPVEIGLTPIKAPKGLFVIAAVLDITAGWEAERALAQKVYELERANERLAQFAYVASHDLQEPLRKIEAFSDLVGKGIESSFDSDVTYANQAIRMAASHGRSLIEDLLTYSRTINAPQQLRELDLLDEIESVLNDLAQAVNETGAVIRTEVSHIRFTADANQFARLMHILVSNAIKYRKPNEVPRITVKSTLLDKTKALLEIEDNSVGFDEKYAQAIFEPFRQVRSQTRYDAGIELAICKSIADRHGWLISVKSQPGIGASFFITIPIISRQ